TASTHRARPTSLPSARRASTPAAHHLDLRLELDPKPALHLGHHPLDEPARVDGRRAALVDDEVAVQGGYDGRALAGALQPGGLNQPAGGVSWRVLEDAAAVLGLDRLRLVSLPRQLRHQLLGLLAVATLQLHGRGDDERPLQGAVAQRRGAVAELERGRRPPLAPAARHEALRLDQDLA